MELITMYTTPYCGDCRRAKWFLKERGVAFSEVNIEEDPSAEDIVLKANQGRRKVPTFKIGERYFASSPFEAEQIATELNIPLNP